MATGSKKLSSGDPVMWFVVLVLALLIVAVAAKDLGDINNCEFECGGEFDPSSDSYMSCMFGCNGVYLRAHGGTNGEDKKMKRYADDDPFSCEDHCRESFEPDSAKFRLCMRIYRA